MEGMQMKKAPLLFAVILLVGLAAPAFAEWELGMSWTGSQDLDLPKAQQKTDSVLGFHVGYGWFILYASWDAYAMPVHWVEHATSPDARMPGYQVPAFLNLYDVGLRLALRPFVGYAEIGTNSLRLYDGRTFSKFGANVRLGVGLKFRWWGIGFSGTQVFASMDEAGAVLEGLGKADTRDWAWKQITEGMIPSLTVTLYL
jgi:hypothetical protein